MFHLAGESQPVLDDRWLEGYSAKDRWNLPEIVEQHHGRKSILIASQIPLNRWPKVIKEPKIEDAALNHIARNADRVDLKGESQRNRRVQRVLRCRLPPTHRNGSLDIR